MDCYARPVKFIKNSLTLCIAEGGGKLKLSATRSIECDVDNTAGGINYLNDIFFVDNQF